MVSKIEFGAPKMCLWLSGGPSGRQDGVWDASRPIFGRFFIHVGGGSILGSFFEDFWHFVLQQVLNIVFIRFGTDLGSFVDRFGIVLG